MNSRKFFVLLGIVLCVSLVLRLWQLDADAPRDVSKDLSLSIDGSWYTAPALDRVVGRANDLTSAYDKPVYSAYAWILYTFLGTDQSVTNLISVPAGIVTILFAALSARMLYGAEAGLLAALLLGANYSFFVFNRSPVVYSCVAMFVAITFYLVLKGSRERRLFLVVCGWLVCVSTALFLKEIVVLAVPALCLAWPVKERLFSSRRGSWVAVAAVLAVVVTAGCFFDIHAKVFQKFNDYFLRDSETGLLARIFDLERRGGLFRAAPWMTTLAVFGGLLRPLDREEKVLAAYSVGGLLAFGLLSYSPLRYLLVFFPVLAVQSAAVLRYLFVAGTERAAPRGSAWTTPFKAALAAYFGYQLCLFICPESPLARGVLWLSAVGVPLCLYFLPRPRESVGNRVRDILGRVLSGTRRPAVGAVCIVLFLVPHAYRTCLVFAAPQHTVARSLDEVNCIVSDGAVLSGLYAHLLTAENSLDRRLAPAVRFGKGQLKKAYEELGVTHMTLPIEETTAEILARFEADGAALTPVHMFHIRGTPVGLFRFPWAEESYRRSRYEQGVDAYRQEDYADAVANFRASIAEHPLAGAPRSALAETLLAEGRTEEASVWLEQAMQRNPAEVRARALKAKLLLDAGQTRQALPCLEKILTLEPGNHSVRDLVERLREGG